MFCRNCQQLKNEVKSLNKRIKKLEDFIEKFNKISVYFYGENEKYIEKITIDFYSSEYLMKYYSADLIHSFFNSSKLGKEKELHCKIIIFNNRKELIIHNNLGNLNKIIEHLHK